MTLTAARRRTLYNELELDGVHWVASEGSILVPESRAVLITIGIRLQSQGKWSHNWRATYGRTLTLRKRAVYALALVPLAQVTAHLRGAARVIVFTRLAPRKLDTDNLAAVFKPLRDQVCCWLAGDNTTSARADDGVRSGYVFEYRQQAQRLYGARVELQP